MKDKFLMIYPKYLTQNLSLSNPSFDKTRLYIRLLVIFFNGFITLPLVVVFWASLWDILYEDLYPDNIPLSLLITWIVGNLILFALYLTQDLFQSLHSRLSSEISKFILRGIYSYLLSLAYLFNYRSYWDGYSYYTQNIDYKVFLAISLFSTVIYRYVCKGSWDAFNESVPFSVVVTDKFDEYFLLNSFVDSKNIWLNRILDFLYFEFIVNIYFIIIWRGVYDLVETGANDFFADFYEENVIASLIFCFCWSFSIYLLFMLFQNSVKPTINKFLGKFTTYALDMIEFMIYFTIVAYWRVIWEVYDLIVYIEELEEYRTYIFYVSHFISFLIMFSFGLSQCISGIGGDYVL